RDRPGERQGLQPLSARPHPRRSRQAIMDCFARTGFGRSPGGLQTFRRAGQRLDQGHPGSRRRAEESKAAKHPKESRAQESVARTKLTEENTATDFSGQASIILQKLTL